MNKVCIIIPYFGEFNNYFDLWINSASYNSKIDFFIFTSNKLNRKMPSNIKWIEISFDNVVSRIQKMIDFKISLDTPYKLVDYKPVYGAIFQEYIYDYKWWGFGDIDVIYGDLSPYIEDDILEQYDKILDLGHLTLIKNTYENNMIWKMECEKTWNYKYAYRFPFCFHFDEGGGFSFITNQYLKNVYHELPNKMKFADICPNDLGFRIAYSSDNSNYVFLWKNGKIYGYKCVNNIIEKKEFTYLHLQKRKMNLEMDKIEIMKKNGFYVLPNKFIDMNDIKIDSDLINNCSNYINKPLDENILLKIKRKISFKYIYEKIIYKYIYIIQKKNKIPILSNEKYFEDLMKNLE